MRKLGFVTATAMAAVLLAAPIASACGFLVAANGAVRLGRTSTFVAWEDGIEHYITNFTYEGEVESFGSLIPLPTEPTDVRRAGDWTLQRLQIEVARDNDLFRLGEVAFFAAADVEVLFRTQIDSLDVVVLKGGGADVLAWVNDNGFNLPEGPTTAHLLEFYSSRSPYFLAARFDADLAQQDDFIAGDGIPVQITMPTKRPWVPLHILHGAKADSEVIKADVYLLTPDRPDLLYGEGLTLEISEPADDLLLADLRFDEGMDWIPEKAWFTYLVLDTDADNVTYDLSVGVEGSPPSFVDAGFTRFEPTEDHLQAMGLEMADSASEAIWWLLAAAGVGGLVGGLIVQRKNPA